MIYWYISLLVGFCGNKHLRQSLAAIIKKAAIKIKYPTTSTQA